MSDLTDFLLARIAEDEAWVTEHGASHGCEVYDAFATSAADCGEMTVGFKRWLTECEAKRRIVEEATGQHTSSEEGYSILRIMATVHADHPDYRAEWRP